MARSPNLPPKNYVSELIFLLVLVLVYVVFAIVQHDGNWAFDDSRAWLVKGAVQEELTKIAENGKKQREMYADCQKDNAKLQNEKTAWKKDKKHLMFQNDSLRNVIANMPVAAPSSPPQFIKKLPSVHKRYRVRRRYRYERYGPAAPICGCPTD